MLSHPESGFSEADRQALLSLARSAIISAFRAEQPASSSNDPACFALRRGVFVTIHVAGKLRGCIGVIEGRETLRDSITHCARSAAFSDQRFAKLLPEEIDGLAIEISVLSELYPIKPQEIIVGTHGLLIASGEKHGLLLPQVAVEHHLSAEQFLEETCRKAGLPRDAWQDTQAKLFGFSCEIFHDSGYQEQK